MALLLTSSFSILSSPSSSTSGLAAHRVLRLCHQPIRLPHRRKAYGGSKIQAPFTVHNRGSLIVKASSDVDGTDGEEKVPFENLPLELKVQSIHEQMMRMKMAKKIRLRRKRLVRKRHLRKKGRWPPSNMNKNKNV
ncbi:hypothetical protein OROGR_016943 [Orobanche gracilis]